MKTLYLIGMPGSGKSALGQALAKSLGRPFLDTDQEIAQRTGRTAEEIIAQDGEEAFRRLEHDLFQELHGHSSLVVSTGGGFPLFNDHMARMNEEALVIYLRFPPEVLWERLKADRHRPLSDTWEKTVALYSRRKPVYETARLIYDGGEDFQGNLKGILQLLKQSCPESFYRSL